MRCSILMKCPQFLTLLFSLLLATPSQADTITVAVAANVRYAFVDLQKAFSDSTGTTVNATFGSSGNLVAQITNGAPFDLLLSADMEYPDRLFRDSLAESAPRIYAYGKLVVWTMKDIQIENWQQLAALPSVTRIAVANPQTAPYGREAMRAFAQLHLKEMVQPKLVFGESVAQTVQFISTGSVDFGVVALSMVLSSELLGKGRWVLVPPESYDPIAQGVVITKYGVKIHPKSSHLLVDFLSSMSARKIFQKYGYGLP